jgi:uncharacterized protein (DUF305 family)
MHASMGNKNYGRLGVMFILHFIAMYILMYAMVHSLAENVYNSLNQFYMAGLMTASMGVIELAIMRSMYSNKKWNAMIIAVSVVALIGFFMFIRQQTGIHDTQFIRSMIPHHSGAILMCEEAAIQDPELRELCGTIMSGQQAEIDQMKAILKRLGQHR